MCIRLCWLLRRKLTPEPSAPWTYTSASGLDISHNSALAHTKTPKWPKAMIFQMQHLSLVIWTLFPKHFLVFMAVFNVALPISVKDCFCYLSQLQMHSWLGFSHCFCNLLSRTHVYQNSVLGKHTFSFFSKLGLTSINGEWEIPTTSGVHDVTNFILILSHYWRAILKC